MAVSGAQTSVADLSSSQSVEAKKLLMGGVADGEKTGESASTGTATAADTSNTEGTEAEGGEACKDKEGGEELRPENSVQVSTEKPVNFYAMVARRLLSGKAGKDAFKEVKISGLGSAIKTAVGVVGLMERENTAVIGNIETSMFESSKNKRRVPKISISITKGEKLVLYSEKEEKVSARLKEEADKDCKREDCPEDPEKN
eukprot:GHVQ01002095.1.p1 GENE.GHVQ01002095.1~~GHVQ01002095.1.p1  ORF type:complete len:236 (+),score=71.15 GHVQ01002095.1:106-708(+)